MPTQSQQRTYSVADVAIRQLGYTTTDGRTGYALAALWAVGQASAQALADTATPDTTLGDMVAAHQLKVVALACPQCMADPADDGWLVALAVRGGGAVVVPSEQEAVVELRSYIAAHPGF